MYKIGDIIENTQSFGTVKVTDVFMSPTTGQYCYCVVDANDEQIFYLCWEGQLNETIKQ